MTRFMDLWTEALLSSLSDASLLVGDLPEAKCFTRSKLGTGVSGFHLNFEQKLGHLYEDALLHLLEQSEVLSPLAAHLQVIDGSRVTVGEMDFLVRDAQAQRDLHLELAVKFYLAHQRDCRWHFPGPDARDNWHRKLARMRTHQLRMTERPEARELLREQFGVEEVDVQQLIYGRLFVPVERDDCPLPEGMSEDGLRGRWLYCHQWGRLFASVKTIRVIPKLLWPALLNEALVESLPVVSEADLLGQASVRCTMFVAGDSPEPFFLVPDSWPNA
ncbi:MAG: DUF1853 family protein [Coraliomargarita sp.]|nr:DUF1853 family protein [Coraliomargarita sp.]